MVGTMDEGRITDYFMNKSILITGSTGFLGKILVEKILRVQPDVKKIYLLVRSVDAATAKQRVETEDQVIALQYVSSELQLADFFTKAQTRAQHGFYLSKLSVVDPP